MDENTKKKLWVFCGVLLVAVLFLLPNFKPELFKNEDGSVSWISRPIALGLDLRGGVHLMYEVQTEEAVRSKLQSRAQAIRAELRKEKVPVTRAAVSPDNKLEITLFNARLLSKAREVIQNLYQTEMILSETRDATSETSKPVLVYGISEQEALRIKKDSVVQAVETLTRRVDQFGVSEPLVQRVGENRIMLQMPGVRDIEAVKRVVGKVAQLEFRLVAQGGGDDTVKLKEKSGAMVSVEGGALMTGELVKRADAKLTPPIEVLLSFNTEGARLFRQITTEHVGRQLAIILDSVVYSSPVIREPIGGGQASISGGFTAEEASELSKVLRAGALPASLKILEERTVGPTLGQQSIQAGILASVVGIVLIFFFMVFYYRKSGVLAMVSIALNVVLLMAVLSLFGATLTLPGLAGLSLTAAMAVDANILIFERIRDELRNGASRDAAVASGFDKAYTAIFDANITTLCAGIILYCFGSGPILGFALNLSVGVLTTVFCATWVCKLFFDILPLKGGKLGLSI